MHTRNYLLLCILLHLLLLARVGTVAQSDDSSSPSLSFSATVTTTSTSRTTREEQEAVVAGDTAIAEESPLLANGATVLQQLDGVAGATRGLFSDLYDSMKRGIVSISNNNPSPGVVSSTSSSSSSIPTLEAQVMENGGSDNAQSQHNLNPRMLQGGPSPTTSSSASASSSASGSASATSSATSSATPSSTATSSATGSATASTTTTASVSASATSSSTSSSTATSSATGSATASVSASATSSSTSSSTATSSATGSATASTTTTASVSASATSSSTSSSTATSSATGSATASVSASATSSSTSSSTATSSATATASSTSSSTVSVTESPTTSATSTVSASSSVTASASSTSAATALSTASASATATESLTATSTASPSATGSSTASLSPFPTSSSTVSSLASPSAMPSVTSVSSSSATSSATTSATVSVTPTASPSPSATSTSSATATSSSTSTVSVTGTASPSSDASTSASPSPSATASQSGTSSPSSSVSVSGTTSPSASTSPTPTVTNMSPTSTRTSTPSGTSSVSAVPSMSASPSASASTSSSATASSSATSSVSVTASSFPTLSSLPSSSADASPTSSTTGTSSPSPSSSASATLSPSDSATATATSTSSGTKSAVPTLSSSPSASASKSADATITSQPSFSATMSGSSSSSPSASTSATGSTTATASVSSSASASMSASESSIATASSIPSLTASASATTSPSSSSSMSASETASITASVSATASPSGSSSGSATISPSSTPTSTVTMSVSPSSSASSSPSATMSTSASAAPTISPSASSTPSSSATVTPTNIPWNHAPEPSAVDSVHYREGSGLLVLIPDLYIYDFENDTLANATIHIANGCSEGDTLSFTSTLSSAGIYAWDWVPFGGKLLDVNGSNAYPDNSTHCTLLLTGACGTSLASWINVLRQQLYYSNALSNPSGNNRTIVVGVWDTGMLLRGHQYGSYAFTLVFDLVNDSPKVDIGNSVDTVDPVGNTLTGIGVSEADCGTNSRSSSSLSSSSSLPLLVTWVEKGPSVPVASGITITDAEYTIASATFQIVSGCTSGDVLSVNTSLLSASTLANLVTNGKITIGNYTDETTAINSNQCTLTLSGIATPANYSSLLQAVTFASSAAWIASHQRTINVTIYDSLANAVNWNSTSVSASWNVSVVPWDDDPFLSVNISSTASALYSYASENNYAPILSYFEQQSSLLAFTPLVFNISDNDSLYLQGITIAISASTCAPGDELGFVSSSISLASTNIAVGRAWAPYGSCDALGVKLTTACTLLLSGVDTLANYAEALRNVTYQNALPNPLNATRQVLFTLQQYTPFISGVTQLNVNTSRTFTSSSLPSAVLYINFTDWNHAPLLNVTTLSASVLQYSEQDAPVELCSGLTVSDFEGDTLQQATVRIISGCAPGDVLAHHVTSLPAGITAFRYVEYNATMIALGAVATAQQLGGALYSSIAGDGAGMSCSLTFVGFASIGSYAQALSHVTFTNALDNPLAHTRIVRFAVTDVCSPKTGLVANTTGTFNSSIVFTAINDAPRIVVRPTAIYYENTELIVAEHIPSSLSLPSSTAVIYATITDPEDDTLQSMTVEITSGCSLGDVLYVGTATTTSPLGWLTSWYSNCILYINGIANTTMYTSVLQAVTFNNTRDDLSGVDRYITFNVTDFAKSGTNGNLTSVSLTSSSTATTLVTVLRTNDNPVLVCGKQSILPAYTESQHAISIDNTSLTLFDWEGDLISQGSISITSGCVMGDILAVNTLLAVGTNLVIGNYTTSASATALGATLGCDSCSISITGIANASTYQNIFRSATFFSTSANSLALTRTVVFSVSDVASTGDAEGLGNGNKNATSICTVPISVSLLNDAPSLKPSGDIVVFVEKAGWIAVDCSILASDPEGDTFAEAVIFISPATCQQGDQLWYNPPSSFVGTPGGTAITITNPQSLAASVASSNSSCTLTLSGVASADDYTVALRHVQYRNILDNGYALVNRSITFIITDSPKFETTNGNKTASATVSLTYVAVNDPPVVSGGVVNATFIEDGVVPVLVDPTARFRLSDIDDANFTSMQITFTAGYLCSEDSVQVPVATLTTIQASKNEEPVSQEWACPIFHINGTASISTYESILRAVTYMNNNTGNPFVSPRRFTVQVSDAGSVGTSNDVAASGTYFASSSLSTPSSFANASGILFVAPRNDRPVISSSLGSGGATGDDDLSIYVEGGAPVALDLFPYLLVTDPDLPFDLVTPHIALIQAKIITGFAPGEDVLALDGSRCAGGLESSWDGVIGTLRIWRQQALASALSPLSFPASTRMTGNVTAGASAFPSNMATCANMSLAEASAAISSIVYKNLNTNRPSAMNRTVTLQVTDDGTIGTSVGIDSLSMLGPIGATFPSPLTSLVTRSSTLTVSVSPVNNAPTIATSSVTPILFVEDSGPLILDSGLLVADEDDYNMTRAFITLDPATYKATEDILTLPPSGGGGYSQYVRGTWVTSNGTLILAALTVNATYVPNASLPTVSWPSSPSANTWAITGTGIGTGSVEGVALSVFRQALRSVTYQNTNTASPSILSRTVFFSVTDASETQPATRVMNGTSIVTTTTYYRTSSLASRTINIQATNDPPTWISPTLSTISVPEQRAFNTTIADFSSRAQFAAPGVYVSDADTADTLTYAVTGGNTGNTWKLASPYSCVLQLNLLNASMVGSGVDYELGTRNWNLVITVTDSNSAADPAGIRNASVIVPIVLLDEDEAPILTSLQSYMLNEGETINALDPPTAATQVDTIIVSDWDIADVNGHGFNITCISPADGDPILLRGLNASNIFALTRTRSTYTLAPGVSPATGYTITLQPGILLSSILAKTFFLRVTAKEILRSPVSALFSNTITFAVYVRRDNAPVTWPSSLYPGKSLTLSVNENAAIGTLVTLPSAPLTAADTDLNQRLTYTIISQTGSLQGLFSILPVPGWTVYDAFTNSTFSQVSRSAHIAVARDALDYETGDRSWTLNIMVTDDAVFNNSRLPSVSTTWATLSVTINLVDIGDIPTLIAISGVPQAGMSTRGETRLLISGTGLGLLDGPASNITASYSNGNVTFQASNCIVTRRLVEIACLSSDGYGIGFQWSISVGTAGSGSGSPQVSAPAPGIRISYAPPQVLLFGPVDAADALANPLNALALGMEDVSAYTECDNENTTGIVGSACTRGVRRIVLTGANFPSIAQSSQGLLSVLYGPTGKEYTGQACRVIEDYRRILCVLVAGVGDNLMWDVNVGWQHSLTPVTSYGLPVISNVVGVESDTSGGTPVALLGYNFGARAELEALQWVQYEPISQPTSPLYPPLYLAAYNCSVTIDHVRIDCVTAPGYHVDFRWRVRVAEQVSPWSTALSSYATPKVISLTPSALATAGKEQLDIIGNNFGDRNVATVVFEGLDVPRTSIVYASHGRLLLPSFPGIGASHDIVLRVGSVRTVSVPFTYAAPSILAISWLSGEGGVQKPLELSVQGANFGECCWCKFYTCPMRCTALEPGCQSDSLTYPGVWHSACIPNVCPATAAEVLQVEIDGIPVTTIKSVMDTEFVIVTPLLEGSVSIIVGQQASNPKLFKLSDLLSTRPQVTTFAVSNVPNNLRDTPPTAGKVTARLSGNNLQFIGTVFVKTPMGVISCPSVYSTIQFQGSGAAGSQLVEVLYGTTILGANAINPANGELLKADPFTQTVTNFTIDPLAQLLSINGTDTWVVRPLLCWVTAWYRNPKFIENDGYIDFIFPPGQGEVQLFVNSKTVNLNSSEILALRVSYIQPTITLMDPDHGPTEGLRITLSMDNAPPALDLKTIWSPYLLPFSDGPVDLSAAPVNKVSFKLSGLDPTPRDCEILTWILSKIVCTAPEGIPGTPFVVYVEDDKFVQSNAYKFDFDPGIIYQQQIPYPHGPTVGGTLMTLRGYSLGRSSSISSEGVASGVTIYMSPVSGSGFVQEKIIEQPVRIISHNHTTISFIVLRGEGSAFIAVRFVLPTGFSITNARLTAIITTSLYPFAVQTIDDTLALTNPPSTIFFIYDPPVVLSIESDGNPCTGLGDDFVRDFPFKVNKTYSGDGKNNFLCFSARNYPRTDAFQGDVMTIQGENFGSGVSNMEVLLQFPDKSDPLQPIKAIKCIPVGGSRSIWLSDSLMRCQLQTETPLQDVIMELTTAFATVRSDRNFSWRLRSVCPYNMFQTSEGEYCQDCYEGALCVGSNAPPRAMAGYWKTIPQEWSTRYLDAIAVKAKPFVTCPFEPACAPNQTCVEGHTGFMCSFCLKNWAGGINQFCKPCVSSGANYGVVGIFFLAACIFGSILIRRAMARRSKIVIVLKMLINFLQMISALRVYLSTEDAPILARRLIQFASLSNYISLDFQAIQCATTFDYYIRFAMYMSIPPSSALVPALFLFGYALLRKLASGKRIDVNRIGRITVTSVGVLLFFTHNSVVIQILRVWNCASKEAGGYLFEQPEISCNSPEHIQLRFLVAPVMGLLYGFGIPLLGVAVLFRVRRTMASRRTLKYYGFMYDGFDVKNGKWWWEPFIMTRKLLFVALGIVITQKNLQIVLGTFVIILVLVMHIQVRPFEDPYLNNLETIALIGNMSMYFGIMVNDLVIDGKLPPYAADIATYLLGFAISIVFACFAYTLWVIALAQVQASRAAAAKRRHERDRITYGETFTKKLVDASGPDGSVPSFFNFREGTLVTRQSRAHKHSDQVAARERTAREQMNLMIRAGPRDGRDRARWLEEQGALFRSMQGGAAGEDMMRSGVRTKKGKIRIAGQNAAFAGGIGSMAASARWKAMKAAGLLNSRALSGLSGFSANSDDTALTGESDDNNINSDNMNKLSQMGSSRRSRSLSGTGDHKTSPTDRHRRRGGSAGGDGSDSDDTDYQDDEGDVFGSHTKKRNKNYNGDSVRRSSRNLLKLQGAQGNLSTATTSLLLKWSNQLHGNKNGDDGSGASVGGDNEPSSWSLGSKLTRSRPPPRASSSNGSQQPRFGVVWGGGSSSADREHTRTGMDDFDDDDDDDDENDYQAERRRGVRFSNGGNHVLADRLAHSTARVKAVTSGSSFSDNDINSRYTPPSRYQLAPYDFSSSHEGNGDPFSLDASDGPVFRSPSDGSAVYTRNIGITANPASDPDPFGSSAIILHARSSNRGDHERRRDRSGRQANTSGRSRNRRRRPPAAVSFGEEFGDSDDDNQYDDEGNNRNRPSWRYNNINDDYSDGSSDGRNSYDEDYDEDDLRDRLGWGNDSPGGQRRQSGSRGRNRSPTGGSGDGLGIGSISTLLFGSRGGNRNNDNDTSNPNDVRGRTRLNPLSNAASRASSSSGISPKKPLNGTSLDPDGLNDENLGFWSNGVTNVARRMRVDPLHQATTVGVGNSSSNNDSSTMAADDPDSIWKQLQEGAGVQSKLTVRGAALLRQASRAASSMRLAGAGQRLDDDNNEQHIDNHPNRTDSNSAMFGMFSPSSSKEGGALGITKAEQDERMYSNPLHSARISMAPKSAGITTTSSSRSSASSSSSAAAFDRQQHELAALAALAASSPLPSLRSNSSGGSSRILGRGSRGGIASTVVSHDGRRITSNPLASILKNSGAGINNMRNAGRTTTILDENIFNNFGGSDALNAEVKWDMNPMRANKVATLAQQPAAGAGGSRSISSISLNTEVPGTMSTSSSSSSSSSASSSAVTTVNPVESMSAISRMLKAGGASMMRLTSGPASTSHSHSSSSSSAITSVSSLRNGVNPLSKHALSSLSAVTRSGTTAILPPIVASTTPVVTPVTDPIATMFTQAQSLLSANNTGGGGGGGLNNLHIRTPMHPSSFRSENQEDSDAESDEGHHVHYVHLSPQRTTGAPSSSTLDELQASLFSPNGGNAMRRNGAVVLPSLNLASAMSSSSSSLSRESHASDPSAPNSATSVGAKQNRLATMKHILPPLAPVSGAGGYLQHAATSSTTARQTGGPVPPPVVLASAPGLVIHSTIPAVVAATNTSFQNQQHQGSGGNGSVGGVVPTRARMSSDQSEIDMQGPADPSGPNSAGGSNRSLIVASSSSTTSTSNNNTGNSKTPGLVTRSVTPVESVPFISSDESIGARRLSDAQQTISSLNELAAQVKVGVALTAAAAATTTTTTTTSSSNNSFGIAMMGSAKSANGNNNTIAKGIGSAGNPLMGFKSNGTKSDTSGTTHNASPGNLPASSPSSSSQTKMKTTGTVKAMTPDESLSSSLMIMSASTTALNVTPSSTATTTTSSSATTSKILGSPVVSEKTNKLASLRKGNAGVGGGGGGGGAGAGADALTSSSTLSSITATGVSSNSSFPVSRPSAGVGGGTSSTVRATGSTSIDPTPLVVTGTGLLLQSIPARSAIKVVDSFSAEEKNNGGGGIAGESDDVFASSSSNGKGQSALSKLRALQQQTKK